MALMMVAIVIMLVSIACIITFSLNVVGKWPYRANSIMHSEVGGAACIMIVLQAFIGWLQPPDVAGRKVFGIAHWLIGTITYYLAGKSKSKINR